MTRDEYVSVVNKNIDQGITEQSQEFLKSIQRALDKVDLSDVKSIVYGKQKQNIALLVTAYEEAVIASIHIVFKALEELGIIPID